MRRTSEEKAITLIALIITIVVLLILAAVAINAVTGDGIIQHATNARDSYGNAQVKEQGILSYYESYLGGTVGKWVQNGTTIKKIDSEGNSIEVRIGDKVEYDEGTGKSTTIDYNFAMKNLEWRVLGVNESGQLELISTDATESTLTLGGEDGYLNGITKLNKVCSDLYSTNIATARSLNIDDINKIAGIITEEDKVAYDGGRGYGIWWQYKFDALAGKIVYRKSEDYNPQTKQGTWTDWTTTTYNSAGDLVFKEPGKEQLDSANTTDIAELQTTKYTYELSSEISSTKVTYDGMSISRLIAGSEEATVAQWIASTCVYCLEGGVQWEIYGIGGGKVASVPVKSSIHDVAPDGWSKSYRVRPVVTLNSNVTLSKGDIEGEWKIDNAN